MAIERTLATLQRIADILDVPVRAFLEPIDAPSRLADPVRLRQTIELVEAFSRITDRDSRHDCIAFVRARQGLPPP